MADAAKNFAKGTVVDGIDADDTSLVLEAGGGLRFPAVPFNAVIWNVTDYPDPADDPGVEILRVTAISTDTLTITRAQEGTDASEHSVEGKTYQLIAPITAKVINDDLVTKTDEVYDLGTATSSAGLYADTLSNLTVIGDRLFNGAGTKVEVDDGAGKVTITNSLDLPNLPDADPTIEGRLYYDPITGIVKRSAG